MSLKTVPAKDQEDAMKANTAATKIQAGFRGYRVRKQLKERREQGSPSTSESEASSPPPLKCQDASSRINLEEKSATKIQAGVRGFLVRKRQQVAAAAATRIQAGFRGFRTRKQLKQSEQ